MWRPSVEDSPLFSKVPPHNLEAERAVLGAALLDREALLTATENLQADDFYDPQHRIAFELMLDMVRKDKPVDPLTFWDSVVKKGLEEKVGGQAVIASFVDAVTTTANADHYVRIVKDKSIHRQLIQVGNEIVRMGYSEEKDLEEVLDASEQLVFRIAQRGTGRGFRQVKDILTETFKNIEERFQHGDTIIGIPTGFTDLDRLIGGLQPGSLNILAARPSMGKTALALNIAQYVAVKKRLPVLIFSLEMGAEQLAQRLLGAEAGVNIHDLRTGLFSENEWENLAEAAGRLSEAPIFIDDSSMLTTLDLKARCRRFKAQFSQAGLVIVDYLQLMSFPRQVDSKQQEVAEISRALKGVAREMEVPVLALSQLSRAVEQRQDKKPQLSDLRDSGAIEQDADLVALLYRPGYYKSDESEDLTAEINIAKDRNGPTDTIKLIFKRELTRFYNCEHFLGSN